MNTVKTFSKEIQEQLIYLKPGNTIKVHFKIQEGEKTRTQVFEGIIIGNHRTKTVDATITVRRVTGGHGVERIFPLHSPLIDKIEIVKIAAKIRQAKINYLRELKGKKARLTEKVLNNRIDIVLSEKVKKETEETAETDKDISKQEEKTEEKQA
jgi:large subunit ribosomal protein L19